MKTDLFQSCGPCWVFQICWHIECSTFTASSFRIWNSSAGIPSPSLAFGTNVIEVSDCEFQIIITRLKHIFINQNRNHYNQLILPMRNKFVYPCSISCASGVNELLESIFGLLLPVEVFSPQKAVEMPEEVVVSWWEARWIWQMKQNFITPFIQLLKHWLHNMWLCNIHLGIVMEKN